jgi:hypothetical protein
MKFSLSFKNLSLFIFLITSTSLVFAGGMEGGGGKSVVCRDPQGKIIKAELLDLFEGRTQYQLKYTESSVPWKEQAQNILTNSGLPSQISFPPHEIIDWFQNASEQLVIVSNEVILKPTDDSYEVIAPKGCNVEQVANYQNDHTILIAGEIWNEFSETQKAALIIHEATYRYLRDYKEANSIRARHFTAFVVSGKKISTPLSVLDNEVGYCYGDDTTFSITAFTDSTGMKKNRLYFRSIAGRHLLSESYADIYSIDMHGFIFLDILKSPPEGMVYSLPFKTNSLFEPGDESWLTISRFQDGQTKIVFKGTSAVDESRFTANLDCLFNSGL